MVIIPLYWTVMTVTSNSNINLPTAYTGSNQQGGPGGNRPNQPGGGSSEMLDYLQANTADVEYLVAVPSSQNGAAFVIATGRPVLYMGGFGGQDEVVTADDLSAMVANGELRYVLYGGQKGNKEDIANWLKTSCSVVPNMTQVTGPAGRQGEGDQTMTLYECK
jgi:4-amino-4-deoxy-L-arabinose transferase-like glycosyltransferase